MHDAPLVSICIPTFNRGRYLRSLLNELSTQMQTFVHSYEIVVADNASPDDTPEVIQGFSACLPIRSFRHTHNIGGFPNWQFVMSQAQGRYLVYLSDDDCLLGDALAATITRLEADPQIAVVYAPWMLYDLVAQKEQGRFYDVPHDLLFERGAHRELLDQVLRHHIFPEVQIVRRDVLHRLMPRINEHAFFAFVHAADYLAQGRVLIQRDPWYVAITRYFDDETREQLGSEEVEIAWDRYRGGLEYLLARCGDAVGADERSGFHLRMQRFIALRMSVAIRLRHLKGRDPVDTWMLAMRLKGLGHESLCPFPMATLRAHAALHFFLRDAELHRGMRQVIVAGEADDSVRQLMRTHADKPVEFMASVPPAAGLADTLVLLRDGAVPPDVSEAELTARGVRILSEQVLFERFGG
jgi:hypothetical protein